MKILCALILLISLGCATTEPVITDRLALRLDKLEIENAKLAFQIQIIAQANGQLRVQIVELQDRITTGEMNLSILGMRVKLYMDSHREDY